MAEVPVTCRRFEQRVSGGLPGVPCCRRIVARRRAPGLKFWCAALGAGAVGSSPVVSAALSMAVALRSCLTSSRVNARCRPGRPASGTSCTLSTPSQLAPLASVSMAAGYWPWSAHARPPPRTAADGIAVELDGGLRIKRLVDRYQRGRFLVFAADRHDPALAVDVIEVLIADDGGHAVFAHHFLDHVGLRRLLVRAKVRLRATK